MASGQRQAELWGPSAELWAKNLEAYSLPCAEWVFDRILNGGGQHLLDAGCGSGGALRIALARGARITGTDVAEEMLAICRSIMPREEFCVADTEALPFADGTFDVVAALNSLQFTENPANALRELKRVAKPDAPIGIACFGETEFSDFAAVGAAVRRLFTTPPTFEGPFSLSPPAKLHRAVAAAGLTIQESADIDLTREFESFDEYWHSQSGTGATRFSVRELGVEPVRNAMEGAARRFANTQGRLVMTNRFHVLIAR
ncbi:MAG: class I SAM-dependent methyltransferase [bacterium]|nr:class I SAM-dependent methyltransferase [bacterium]